MKLILDIAVKITGSGGVKGNYSDAVMITFTGTADGPYFKGSIIGTGVDTQKTPKDGATRLSARYMLEGVDLNGEPCRIFIENNSNEKGGFTPVIVTDSKALSEWERSPLSAEISPTAEGVNVKIYMIEDS